MRKTCICFVTLEDGCTAHGQSLSSIYMPEQINPPIPIKVEFKAFGDPCTKKYKSFGWHKNWTLEYASLREQEPTYPMNVQKWFTMPS